MPLALLLTLLGFAPSPTLAADISQYTVEYSTTTAPLILEAIAHKHGIEPEPFIKTAECESNFIPQQSKIRAKGPNGREDSWGIFQIHLPSHPTVSKTEAMDPWFAAEWAAQQFAEGNQRIWTCYRALYPKSSR